MLEIMDCISSIFDGICDYVVVKLEDILMTHAYWPETPSQYAKTPRRRLDYGQTIIHIQ